MNKLRTILVSALVLAAGVAAVAGLAGCGQKGPLVLPAPLNAASNALTR